MGVRGRYAEVVDPTVGANKAIAGVVLQLIVELHLKQIIGSQEQQELTELLQNKSYEAVKDRMVGLGLTLTYGTAGPWPEAEAETRSAQD